MERIPVTSTSIASVGYDAASYVLEVEFGNGHVYQYFDVPESVVREFREASSLGTYLNMYIRDAYRCTQIEDQH
jgi:hypothetical protein